MKTPVAWSELARVNVEEVFHRFGSRIARVARTWGANGPDAEDVAQEVLLSILRNARSYRGRASLWSWVYRITVNAALRFRQRKARRRELSLQSLDDAAEHLAAPDDPAREIEQREQLQSLRDAVAGLPPAYRDVYTLAALDEMPLRQVAGQLHLHIPAVKSRLHRARRLLRTKLQARHADFAPSGNGQLAGPDRERRPHAVYEHVPVGINGS